MKSAVLSGLMGLAVAGCEKNSGLVFVDYDAAEANGIKVTSFTDSPFNAMIEYDYSGIEGFNVSNLTVTLVRNVIPLEDWKDPAKVAKYSARQVELQKKLMSLTTVDGESIQKRADRKATVTKNEPGKLKIFCLDDIGAYRIEYKK